MILVKVEKDEMFPIKISPPTLGVRFKVMVKFVGEQWCLASEGGKPLVFRSEKSANKKADEIHKRLNKK